MFNISTHAPTKGATSAAVIAAVCNVDFNPRSHKGSDLLQALVNNLRGDFNPRSHKGSDCERRVIAPAVSISTHAPTKGATRARAEQPRKVLYFNPRSHKGSDKSSAPGSGSWRPFQPTLPQRERQRGLRISITCVDISTHAPTKGATSGFTWSPQIQTDFNPRSHKGSDKGMDASERAVAISTHAPTKGATVPDKRSGATI